MRMKLFLFMSCCLIVASAQSQTLFTYGPYKVSKEEFLRAYNKNNVPAADKEEALRDYYDLYANFKLKVQAAEDMKLDTLPQLKKDLEDFKAQVQDNYLNDEEGLKSLIHEAYLRGRKDLHVLHFSISVPAQSTASDTSTAYKKILEAQRLLSKGNIDYKAVAGNTGVKFSDLGYITVFSLPYIYENIVYNLNPGEVSAPVKVKNTWHLFKLADERNSIGKWKIAQILLVYPPDANDSAKEKIMEKADSVYRLAVNGSDFALLASEYSQDRYTYNTGGELPEFGSGKYEPSFEEQVLKLKSDGDIGKPFATSFGVHILKRISHTDLPNREDDPGLQFEYRQKILQDSRINEAKEKFIRDAKRATGFKLTNRVKESDLFRYADSVLVDLSVNNSATYPISKKVLFSFSKGSKTGADWLNFVRDYKGNPSLYQQENDKGLWEKFQHVSVLQYYKEHLEQYNKQFAYQMKEFRDGNMLFEVMERKVWGKAASDSSGLLGYYSAHQSNYLWPESADVILVTASNEQIAHQTMKELDSGKPWKTILEEGNAMVQLDSGRYELNQIFDHQTKQKPQPGSYSAINHNQDGSVSLTKYIRFYPAKQQRSFDEARGLVINDYQNVIEKEWIATLRKKYPVKLNETVFRQVVDEEKAK